MSRPLTDRELAALSSAVAGELFRVRSTGRYESRTGGGRPHTCTAPGRLLAASGLIAMEPLPSRRGGGVWERAVPTVMGLLAWQRESAAREPVQSTIEDKEAVS
jgi:hypothetical protein